MGEDSGENPGRRAVVGGVECFLFLNNLSLNNNNNNNKNLYLIRLGYLALLLIGDTHKKRNCKLRMKKSFHFEKVFFLLHISYLIYSQLRLISQDPQNSCRISAIKRISVVS